MPKAPSLLPEGLEIGTWWHENGQKKYETTWVAGKLRGAATGWYKSGRKHTIWPWVDSKEHGVMTMWYESGSKQKEVYFLLDKEFASIEWNEDGGVSLANFPAHSANRSANPLSNNKRKSKH